MVWPLQSVDGGLLILVRSPPPLYAHREWGYYFSSLYTNGITTGVGNILLVLAYPLLLVNPRSHGPRMRQRRCHLIRLPDNMRVQPISMLIFSP